MGVSRRPQENGKLRGRIIAASTNIANFRQVETGDWYTFNHLIRSRPPRQVFRLPLAESFPHSVFFGFGFFFFLQIKTEAEKNGQWPMINLPSSPVYLSAPFSGVQKPLFRFRSFSWRITPSA